MNNQNDPIKYLIDTTITQIGSTAQALGRAEERISSADAQCVIAGVKLSEIVKVNNKITAKKTRATRMISNLKRELKQENIKLHQINKERTLAASLLQKVCKEINHKCGGGKRLSDRNVANSTRGALLAVFNMLGDETLRDDIKVYVENFLEQPKFQIDEDNKDNDILELTNAALAEWHSETEIPF